MRPIFYSFRRCPYAMRARMAIQHSGIECELREVVLKNKPAEMLQASPKGTVPVLVDGDRVIDESIDIMGWALNQYDDTNWLIHSLDHELIQRNDDEFKFYLDRYKYFDRYKEEEIHSQSEKSQLGYFDQALIFLNELECRLVADAKGDYFLDSYYATVLDISIFPFVRQFAFVDKPLFDNQNLPKLHAWLAFFIESSLFTEVMAKYTAWHPEQEDCVLFGT